MVVLNVFGKIEPICISEKLKLYVSNISNEKYNKWRDYLCDEMIEALKVREIRMKKGRNDCRQFIESVYLNHFPEEIVDEKSIKDMYFEIAGNMICITLSYECEDMPMGDWKTNCFDGRFCEEDYAEKIVDFISFVFDENNICPKPIPKWIYSSNYDETNIYRLFWQSKNIEYYIEPLKKWGDLLDNFLRKKNDYLLFDFIVNALHRDNEYNEYHLLKAYSLCQLFLEKKQEIELDFKLPFLIDDVYSPIEKREMAIKLRKMRNKIAHGGIIGFERTIEKFAQAHMDGRFCFDYTEYSRKNWVVMHVCCILDDIVRKLVVMMLFNRQDVDRIKNISKKFDND